MRILQARFKNLNSLAGEWEIDFTHPDYVSDGIFAITGPTGAGKSTILDAICLALYGRTPRLSKMSQSENEIMSRQTAECFAEVAFETTQGRYRCHWSQHRARKKADGALQQPQHEIADMDSGQIIESKIRAVAGVIEKTTGMDFDRFTRSMLLAQGGFAAFLQAAPDDRAPILEQITGTEIYSQISVRVHERRHEEHNKLEVLNAELSGMQLLDTGQEAVLQASLKEKSGQITALQAEVDAHARAVNWLDSLEKLEQDLAGIAGQQQALHARTQHFTSERARLVRALAALELDAEHSRLMLLRQELLADERSLNDGNAQLPALVQEGEAGTETLALAVQALNTAQADHQAAQPNLRSARELDLLIGEKTQQLTAVDQAMASESARLSSLKQKQEADASERTGKQQALEAELDWQREHQRDEALVADLAGIESQLNAQQALNDGYMARRNQLQEAASQRSAQEQAYTRQRQGEQQCESAFAQHQQALLASQRAQAAALEGMTLAAWRERLESVRQRKDLLEKAGAALHAMREISAALEQGDVQVQGFITALGQAAQNIDAVRTRQSQLEKEEAMLQTQLALLQRIASLEEARQHLHAGEPCPLCGALDHPYGEDGAPLPDETRQQLADKREALIAVRAAFTAATVNETEIRKDLQQAQAKREADKVRLSNETAAFAQLQREWKGLRHDGEVESELPTAENLEPLLLQAGEAVSQVQDTVNQAERADRDIATLRTALEQARDALAAANRQTQQARSEYDSTVQRHVHLQQELADAQAQREHSLETLGRTLALYGWNALAQEDIAGVMPKLIMRRSQWLAHQQHRSVLERDIALLDAQLLQQRSQIDGLAQDLRSRQVQREALKAQCDALVLRRQALLGDRQPDHVERELAVALDLARQKHEQARTAHEACERRLQALQSRLQELTQKLKARATRIEEVAPAFLLRLHAAGFEDENDFNAARLPEAERRALEVQASQLAHEHAALAAREAENKARLAQLRQERLTDKPRDVLTEQLGSLRTALQDATLETAALRNRLDDNDRLKRSQQQRMLLIEAQQRECARWDQLHVLIGSADGKKFRNFAQGLTFEMMIGHANRQLQEMTDRYLLVRDDAHPLELKVMDNYQAGEVRSTKNLSGGESFIVSLALALGLSGMASRNVPVDSLFLDEGFGTLDEDALDTALTTLASLQQAGKLIGVISHVSALKERISTQIQVHPRSGGRSSVSGPGCRQLAP